MAFANIDIGSGFPEIINTVVEIPRGTHNKYEYSEDLDEIVLDRVIHSAVIYPADYGFIPQTRSSDGDHLDVLIIVSDPLFPGCVLSTRVIGVLGMEDEKGEDDKIVAVAENDPRLADIKNITDLDNNYRDIIANFFQVYKQLEKKPVKVKGWLPREKAIEIIKIAHQKFNQEKK